MTKYRLVQCIAGRMIVSEFDEQNILPAMEARGYTFTGLNNNHRQRTELQHQPVFSQLYGPMWDGDAIRYEDQKANDHLSI
jgi:hypothetical protein